MGEIAWTQRAQEDLLEIHRFIARDSLRAADAVFERIIAGAVRVADHPERGRVVPEFPMLGYREVIVRPYRVIYRLVGPMVLVTAVMHGSRLLSSERVEESVAVYG